MHFAPGVSEPSKSSSGGNSKTVPAKKMEGGKEAPEGEKVEEGKRVGEGEEIVEGEEPKGEALNPTPDAAPVISGMRGSASVLVWVDLKKSMQVGGLKWWRSANGVVLTEGDERGFVRLEFVDSAERRGTGEVIWRNKGLERKGKEQRGGEDGEERG